MPWHWVPGCQYYPRVVELGQLAPHGVQFCVDGLLMGMCEWVSDSRESAWLANPCKTRFRITDVHCPDHVGSAYGRATRIISRRHVNHCRIRANPLGLRIPVNWVSASRANTILVWPSRISWPHIGFSSPIYLQLSASSPYLGLSPL